MSPPRTGGPVSRMDPAVPTLEIRAREPASQAPTSPELERLEAVLLPAASVAAGLTRGTLAVHGTEGPDQIEVRLRVLSTRLAGTPRVSAVVLVDGRARYRTTTRLLDVAVEGHQGDDRVSIVQTGRVAIRARVDGGDGNDQLWGSSAGDTLVGGTGLDSINGLAEPPPAAPVRIPTSPPEPAPYTPRSVDTAAIAREIVDRTNRERQAAGVGTLRVNDQLTRMAQLQADQMASLGRMDHTLPEAAYPTLQGRVDSVGYRFTRLGENLAYNYPDAANVMLAWLLSEGHRDNMLHPDFQDIGVGVSSSKAGELYYVQVFGRPE